MKYVPLLFVLIQIISCTGITLEKHQILSKKGKNIFPYGQNSEKLAHLKILERHFLYENKKMKLSIARGMIMELNGTPLKATNKTPPDLKELKKNQNFVALQMTIEHLSHRAEFKPLNRHSAFHKRP